MDDELKTLEAELTRLRPAAPSPRLLATLERQLSTVATFPRAVPSRRWWLVVLPAAAAFVLGFSLYRKSTLPLGVEAAAGSGAAVTNPGGVLKPVTAENVLIAADDEGVVTLEDGTPARRQRLHYVDTITFRNSRTNASLTWRVPREEVRVVPIAFQ